MIVCRGENERDTSLGDDVYGRDGEGMMESSVDAGCTCDGVEEDGGARRISMVVRISDVSLEISAET